MSQGVRSDLTCLALTLLLVALSALAIGFADDRQRDIDRIRQVLDSAPSDATLARGSGIDIAPGYSMSAHLVEPQFFRLEAFAHGSGVSAWLALTASTLCVLATLVAMARSRRLAGRSRSSVAELLTDWRRLQRSHRPTLGALTWTYAATLISLLASLAFWSASDPATLASFGYRQMVPTVLGVLFAAGLAVTLVLITRRGARGRVDKPAAPLPLYARAVTTRDAPMLWEAVTRIAGTLDVPPPAHVVLGAADRIFVSDRSLRLLPSEEILEGRTLHLDLASLAQLSPEDARAPIAQALAYGLTDATGDGAALTDTLDTLGSFKAHQDTTAGRSPWHAIIMAPARYWATRDHARAADAYRTLRDRQTLRADASSLACTGAATQAGALVLATLTDIARSTVFSTAMTAYAAPAGLPALAVVKRMDEMVATFADQPDELPWVVSPETNDATLFQRLDRLGVSPDEAAAWVVARRAPIAESALGAFLDHDFTLADAVDAELLAGFSAEHAEWRETLEQHADTTAVAQTYRADPRVAVWLLTLYAAVLVVLGIAIGTTSLFAAGPGWLPALPIAGGAICLAIAFGYHRRGGAVMLSITDDALVSRTLTAPLPLHALERAGLGQRLGSHRLDLQLTPEATLPKPRRRANGTIVDRDQRIVSLRLGPLCTSTGRATPASVLETLTQAANRRISRQTLQAIDFAARDYQWQ